MKRGPCQFRGKKVTVLSFGLALLFAACLNLNQPRSKVEFYTLEYDPPQIANRETLPFVIRTERFAIAPTYNTYQIIYRDKSFERDAYVYHKWRDNPGDLISHLLIRDLGRSGLFRAALPHGSTLSSSHRLEGSVDEFFEWDREDGWDAVLAVSVVLMAEHEPDASKKIVYQRTYRTTKACKQRNPRALAEAMSQAMAEVSAEIIRDIYDALKGRAEEGQGGHKRITKVESQESWAYSPPSLMN